MTEIAYVANSNVLDLTGLKSEIEDVFIDDATVEVTVNTKDGVPVGGQTWPLAMDYVAASNGNYRAILSEDIEFLNKGSYIAVIDANAGAGRVGHWEFPFKAQTRTGA